MSPLDATPGGSTEYEFDVASWYFPKTSCYFMNGQACSGFYDQGKTAKGTLGLCIVTVKAITPI
jgi:hypothetical protein